MNELTQQMEEDQTDVIDKTKNIASLASQVKKLKALEDEIKFDEDLIKKKKKNLEQISGEIIPTLLRANNISFTLLVKEATSSFLFAVVSSTTSLIVPPVLSFNTDIDLAGIALSDLNACLTLSILYCFF